MTYPDPQQAFRPPPPGQPGYGTPPPYGWPQPPVPQAPYPEPGPQVVQRRQHHKPPSNDPKNTRRWLIPAGTGLLGLLIGAGVNGDDTSTRTPPADSTSTVTQTATITELSTVTVTAKPAGVKPTSTPMNAKPTASTTRVQKAVDLPASSTKARTMSSTGKTSSKPPAAPPSVYYANCSAARAAGAAPLHIGEPGYRSGLDRDGDGVACE